MSIQNLCDLYEKGFLIIMDGDNRVFIIEHAEKKIKGFMNIRKDSLQTVQSI